MNENLIGQNWFVSEPRWVILGFENRKKRKWSFMQHISEMRGHEEMKENPCKFAPPPFVYTRACGCV